MFNVLIGLVCFCYKFNVNSYFSLHFSWTHVNHLFFPCLPFFSDVEVSFNISCEKPFDLTPNTGQLLPHSRSTINIDFKPEVLIYTLNLHGNCKFNICSTISLYFLSNLLNFCTCMLVCQISWQRLVILLSKDGD